MSWPFDAYQTVTLLIAGAAALAGYSHVRFQSTDNEKRVTKLEASTKAAEAKVQALELADAKHDGLMAIIDNLKDTLRDLQHELKNQRNITQQLERVVARLEGASRAD